MNTKLTYLYRDASNYKQWEEIVIAGELLMPHIVPHLWEGTFFIPSAVGLPDLAQRFEQQDYEFPTEDDHPWHELAECVPSDDAPTFDMSAEELQRRIVRCHEDGWESFIGGMQRDGTV